MLKSDPGLTFIFNFVVAEIGCKTDQKMKDVFILVNKC